MVFDRAWFARHQRTLLWLLNTPLIGRWFRWVLCIRASDIGYAREIVAIYSHAYEVQNADGSQTIEIRTHAKYAKRLFHAFRWLWLLCHAWDLGVANRWCHALNFGFDSLTAFPEANEPAVLVEDSYLTLTPGGAGSSFATLVSTSTASSKIGGSSFSAALVGGSSSDLFSRLNRIFTAFDTSVLPPASAISSATVSYLGQTKANQLGSTGIAIVDALVADNANVDVSEFGAIGAVKFAEKNYADIVADFATYNDFSLNAAGIAAIQPYGATTLAAILQWDFDQSFGGAWAADPNKSEVTFASADTPGTTQDPKLAITYTAAPLQTLGRITSRKRRAGHSVSSPGGYF